MVWLAICQKDEARARRLVLPHLKSMHLIMWRNLDLHLLRRLRLHLCLLCVVYFGDTNIDITLGNPTSKRMRLYITKFHSEGAVPSPSRGSLQE